MPTSGSLGLRISRLAFRADPCGGRGIPLSCRNSSAGAAVDAGPGTRMGVSSVFGATAALEAVPVSEPAVPFFAVASGTRDRALSKRRKAPRERTPLRLSPPFLPGIPHLIGKSISRSKRRKGEAPFRLVTSVPISNLQGLVAVGRALAGCGCRMRRMRGLMGLQAMLLLRLFLHQLLGLLLVSLFGLLLLGLVGLLLFELLVLGVLLFLEPLAGLLLLLVELFLLLLILLVDFGIASVASRASLGVRNVVRMDNRGRAGGRAVCIWLSLAVFRWWHIAT